MAIGRRFLIQAVATTTGWLTAIAWAADHGALGQAQAGQASIVAFDIPPQALDTALIAYAEQAGVQILAPAELLKGRRTGGLKGRHETGTALAILLHGLDCRVEVTALNTVTIRANPDRLGD